MLRLDAHGRDAHGRCEMQHANRAQEIHEYPRGVLARGEGGGFPGAVPWLGAHILRLLHPRRGEVRLLRVLQEALRGLRGAGERRSVQDVGVSGRVGKRRVHRRHWAVPFRGHQGEGTDAAGVCQGVDGRDAQADRLGRVRGAVQGFGAAVGAADPLHDDEIRHVREHGGAAVPERGASAQVGVLQRNADRRELRGGLHRRNRVRHHLPPGRQPGVVPQQRQGRHRGAGCAGDGLDGAPHARVATAYRHDRNPNCRPVGHLRLLQGLRRLPHHGRPLTHLPLPNSYVPRNNVCSASRFSTLSVGNVPLYNCMFSVT